MSLKNWLSGHYDKYQEERARKAEEREKEDETYNETLESFENASNLKCYHGLYFNMDIGYVLISREYTNTREYRVLRLLDITDYRIIKKAHYQESILESMDTLTTYNGPDNYLDYLAIIITTVDGLEYTLEFCPTYEANYFTKDSIQKAFADAEGVLGIIIYVLDRKKQHAKEEHEKQIERKTQEKEEQKFDVQIRKLKSLLDDGIITQEEFEAKKKKILGI